MKKDYSMMTTRSQMNKSHFKKVFFPVLKHVVLVDRRELLKHTMKTIQNHWRLNGYAKNVTRKNIMDKV